MGLNAPETPSVMLSPKDDLSEPDFRIEEDLRGAAIAADAEAVVETSDEEEPLAPANSRRWFSVSVPAWLVSMMIHIAMIFFMAAYHMPEITKAVSNFIVNSSMTDDTEALETFAIDDAIAIETPQETAEELPSTAPVIQEQVSEVPVDLQIDNPPPSLSVMSVASLSAEIVSSTLSTGSESMKTALRSRSKESKRDLLDRYGGNADTEKAVAAALKWLSEHQMPDGSWTFAHGLVCAGKCADNGRASEARNAATGLALMCYLGAGQTHLEGDYKPTVFKGFTFLIRNMQVTEGKTPSWYVEGRGSTTGVMYSHGIASIAICEAYGMTKDKQLREPAQAGVNFIVYAQDTSNGGWYYSPRSGGDTSVVGWQLMALKSAVMSNLNVPQGTLKKAVKYLDAVGNEAGSAFGYRKRGDRPVYSAMTACGLLCKMYLGLPRDNPGLKEAVSQFAKKGPSTKDVYFNYYATQVLKQIGGPLWQEWDAKMKKYLLSTQEVSGHSAGSWIFKDNGHGQEAGGRLYNTCMATMMLEVYYRYLPLYGDQSEEEAFKL
jgi:hypothetical protein